MGQECRISLGSVSVRECVCVSGSAQSVSFRWETYECLQKQTDVRVTFVCVGGRERGRWRLVEKE